MPSTPLLPEEMKTEEEILAQMRAAQAAKPPKPPTPLSFLAELPTSTAEDSFAAPSSKLDMDQLQKLIRSEDNVTVAPDVNDSVQQKIDKSAKDDQQTAEAPVAKPQSKMPDPKPVKEIKVENKLAKAKDNSTKPKTKTKAKDDKKEESSESKAKEEEVKAEKRSAEPSPSPKTKKEDKSNKKDLEKEKKEWIKEGFTIVKGAEKNKDSKKKTDEAKVAEDAERKRKEEEKIAVEEKKRQSEMIKKQQEVQNQQPAAQRLAAESVSKKAPWSASSQELQSTTWEGPTLAEIQRLEREKKLEQMKEQHQMMQIIANQQAASLAREQEMQGGLGWAKKPATTTQNQTLAEIQAEARAQAAAAAAAQAAQAAAVAREEVQATPPPINSVPWGNSTQNGGAGFWDCPPVEPVKPFAKPADPPKSAEPRPKKKVTVMVPPKPENTPSVEFDMWCANILDSWRDSNIDIPTFVAFLREIESPYEVRDYVKCYLGETREASEFAGQFLERRSRLLRVGMVTPSDDLCSPAMAINPRTNSGSDYTEVKGKAKKTKKNKMLKVDARAILGFSVTASEDRINVGDIDTV